MTQAETIAERADPDANALERLDMEAALELVPDQDGTLARAVQGFSKLGDEPPVFATAGAIAATCLLSGDGRLARKGAHVAAAVLLAYFAKTALKRMVTRTRPSELRERGR